MDAEAQALEEKTRAALGKVAGTLSDKAGGDGAQAPDPLAIGAWRQVLLDLGYLTDVAGTDAPVEALAAFLAEMARTPEFAGFSRARAALESGAILAAGPDDVAEEDALAAEALLEHVSDLLSLDVGGAARLQLSRRPAPGEVSVWSRVVQARLERLGVAESGVGVPYGPDDDFALTRLAVAASDPGVAAQHMEAGAGDHWIGLSGDAAELLALVRRRDRGGWLVARATGFGDAPRADPGTLRIDATGRFAGGTAGPNAGLGRSLRTPHRPRFATPAEALADEGNRLGLRLVQIRLWQLGYYAGRVDGLYGPKTRAALLEAVETFCGHGAFGAAVRHFGDGRIAVNMHFLDEQVFAPATEARDEQTPEAVDEAVAEAGAALAERTDEREAVEEARKGLFERIRDGTRRVFATARRLVSSAVAAVRRGIDKVAEAVSRAVAPIRNLLAAAAAAAASAARRVRRAITLFAHFIFGVPLGRRSGGAAMITLFRPDRDAEVFAIGPIDRRLIAAQRRTVDRLTQALRLGLRIGGLALEAAVAISSPYGWVRLALRILGLLRSAIADRIRRARFRAALA